MDRWKVGQREGRRGGGKERRHEGKLGGRVGRREGGRREENDGENNEIR